MTQDSGHLYVELLIRYNRMIWPIRNPPFCLTKSFHAFQPFSADHSAKMISQILQLIKSHNVQWVGEPDYMNDGRLCLIISPIQLGKR